LKYAKLGEKSLKEKRIAIVHDALIVAGGAERFALALSQLLPNASFFTSAYIPEGTYPEFKSKQIKVLRGSKLIHNEKQFKRLFLLWFFGFRKLCLSDYDIVFSSSTYAAKFVKPRKKAIHISYIHSPFRFIWKRESYTVDSLPYRGWALWLIDLFIPLLQKIDRYYTNQITQIVTNSQNMANFIKKVYQREAIVIYPPVDISQYHISEKKKDFYLFVGRLVSYKRADLAIQACKTLNRNLVIIGEGPEMAYLKNIAGSETTFLGRVSDDLMKQYYSEAKGLIFPGIEDFGLIPVEAQASGCPVIAIRAGGAIETVVEGETGTFFDKQTVEDLVNGLTHFEKVNFSPTRIRESVFRFDTAEFKKQVSSLLELYQ